MNDIYTQLVPNFICFQNLVPIGFRKLFNRNSSLFNFNPIKTLKTKTLGQETEERLQI